ncbi:hypothetical protein CCACVL1_27490 [Corchorus capsularis]|uniref:Uncharacterized protein n=1 Tax=Corchorus capsularis TaxID=210143 RepID=A0A1R3GA06_COCAP|nr:hypothetical protein CCACVL1_27490 [Corchorus capsularis]
MWAKVRASSKTRGEKELRDARKSLNVNEEYFSALRTDSYVEYFSKAQSLANELVPSSPSYFHHKFFQLLEPCQDTIPSILESAILSKIPQLKTLILDYFDISAEASKICGHLLTKINQIQHNYQFIQRALDSFDDYHSPEKVKLIISELNSFTILNNPFSNPNKHDFKMIHDKYSSVLNHLKSKRKKVARKLKLFKFFHKTSVVCLTATCGLVVIIAVVIAAHTLAALLMAPVIFGFPVKLFKKKLFKFPCLKCGFLKKIGEQLDVAAKGTYILNRDFDTMSRLVSRLHDEVEDNKAMIQVCLERKEEKFCLQVVKELKKSIVGFKKQVEELEEHVYLCLVTINRARALVIKEMTTSFTQKFSK